MKLKQLSTMIVIAMLAGACTLHAQETNPISSNLKMSWANIKDLLVKMADKMPDENYRFKPTPEIQDFGQRMAHIVGANIRVCTMVKGDQQNPTFSAAPTKAEVVAAIKQMNSECDSVFTSLSDAGGMKMITGGRGGPRPELAVLESNVLEHSQEVYGYMCVYLRLKGIVPPSSDRNER
jgi:hypothetical protein